MAQADSGNDSPMKGSRQDLIAELREFARAIKEIDGAQAGASGSGVQLPQAQRDRRGRVVDVWDALGGQTSFFYSADSAQPYAYEVRSSARLVVERASQAQAGAEWVIYRRENGLKRNPEPGDLFAHRVLRVEVTAEGALLAIAADGFQVRRDPAGVEYEAHYDEKGCLTEAVRRHQAGVDRTMWHYDGDGNTVATEIKADGTEIESSYDRWGRMLSRREKQDGRESMASVSYNQDGTHTVERLLADGSRQEEGRRRDGTMSQCRLDDPNTGEVVFRKFDERERLVAEEVRSKSGSRVTHWQYGEDGWTEVRQSGSDGNQLLARYDPWGRLVVQRQSKPDGFETTAFSYKPDGSYKVERETSDGLKAEEYYRPDGSRHYSRAESKDGQVVEVEYDAGGRPLKRVKTTHLS